MPREGNARTVRALGWMVLLLVPVLSRADSPATPVKYQAMVRAIEPWIEREVADKKLPALSIALVEDQHVVWAKGFGLADPKAKRPATPDTVYRVGSVSKLFTDIAVMQLVEQGKLDLDAPVSRYLPDFHPRNPFGKDITLRQLMAHRSGLVREPPVGHYFDATNPSLSRTVLSLNDTELVYPPAARIKYSNAAVATVGYVLEKSQNESFARYVRRKVLGPLGMFHSAFEPTPALTKDLATATMWTYHGREFPAPTFELGMAPAACMYSTVADLSQFLQVLFAGGEGRGGRILKRETLEKMWEPQFAKPGEKTGFGLGFLVTSFEGRRRIGHGGAIYGFATELAALPDDKLGVVVIASRDVANGVTSLVADVALQQMLAVKQGKPLPALKETKPLDPGVARHWAGSYRHRGGFDLIERTGQLYFVPVQGGYRGEVRLLGGKNGDRTFKSGALSPFLPDALIVDDPVDYGPILVPDRDWLRINGVAFERIPEQKPPPAPGRWAGLLGEYGWDHDTLFVLEKDNKVWVLIEWFFLYPLVEVTDNVFQFPASGLYQGERLVFSRDAKGRATQAAVGSVVFPRRKLDGENGATFKVEPTRPLAELRKEALAAKPPVESGEFRKSELVDLAPLDPGFRFDLRYATTNNFLSTPFYSSARAFMLREAAEALVRVNHKLAEKGYGLLIHDPYRPWYVTKMFWDATPEKFHLFVADPSKGSRHNRGCAVDLTLYERATGKPVQMVGGFDEFSDRSYPDYWGGTSLQRWHRDLLRRSMEAEGFTVYEAEWWHFDFKEWQKYPIHNETFEQLEAAK